MQLAALPLLLAVAVASTRTGSAASSNNCSGFEVEGAGSFDFNGCYQLSPSPFGGARMFEMDDTHKLYRFEGFWSLGDPGKHCFYRAERPTAAPPSLGSAVSWFDEEGEDPPPTLTRSPSLGPAPTPQPAPAPAPSPKPAPPAPEAQLVVEDDFDGPTLNASLWNVLEQIHRGGVYSADNVFLRNGTLVLQTVARNQTVDGVDYFVASGAINSSAGGLSQHRGRFSARVKLPDVNRSPGYTLHSSIWLITDVSQSHVIPGRPGPAPNISGCPQEIDLVEQYAGSSTPGDYTSRAAGNLHPFSGRSSTSCKKETSHVQYQKYLDLTSDWHVFTLDWLVDRMVMYIDNELVSDMSNATTAGLFTDPLFLAFTSCVMERVLPTDVDIFPQEYLIDWVRVYHWVE